MTEQVTKKTKIASSYQQTPKQILNEVRGQNSKTPINIRDVYNIKHEIRAERLGNLTPTQALSMALQDREQWFYAVEKDPVSKRIERLSFADMTPSRELLAAHYEV